MNDLEMSFKIAAARAETQLKMRGVYLNNIKSVLDTYKLEDLDLMELLSDAYNKGTCDCLTIMMISNEELLDLEGGDHND